MTGSILTVVNCLRIALLVPLVMCGQSITGKIVDPIPAPLPGLVVGLLPIGGDWVTKSTRTGSDGEFRFFPIEPGEYAIIARAPGWRSRVRVVRVSGKADADLGALELGIASCDSTGVCDYVTDAPAAFGARGRSLRRSEKPRPVWKQAGGNRRRALDTPWLANLVRTVRQRTCLGRLDLDQRSTPPRRSRSAANRDPSKRSRFEKEARGSCGGG